MHSKEKVNVEIPLSNRNGGKYVHIGETRVDIFDEVIGEYIEFLRDRSFLCEDLTSGTVDSPAVLYYADFDENGKEIHNFFYSFEDESGTLVRGHVLVDNEAYTRKCTYTRGDNCILNAYVDEDSDYWVKQTSRGIVPVMSSDLYWPLTTFRETVNAEGVNFYGFRIDENYPQEYKN